MGREALNNLVGVVLACLMPLLFLPAANASSADTVAPSTPTGLRASVSGNTVTLSWTASSDNGGYVEYDIHTSSSPAFIPEDDTLLDIATGPTYLDTEIPPGPWYYRVVAVDDAGNTSAPSNEVGVVVPDVTPPSVPASVTPTASGTTVLLTWTGSTDDDAVGRYDVYRSGSSSFQASSSTLIGSTTGTAFSEAAVPGGTWYYGVVAVDGAGNRSAPGYAPSIAVHVLRLPGAPTDLTATAGERGVVLRWRMTDYGLPAADKYVVTIRPGGLQLTSDAEFVSVFGLTTGAAYAFTVYAQNSVGRSPTATSAPFVGKGDGGMADPGAPPLAVLGLRVTPGPGRAVLTWQIPSDGGAGVVVRRTSRDSASGLDRVVEIYRGTGATVTTTGLQEGKVYRFAVSRAGPSPAYTPAQVTLYGSYLYRSRSASRVVHGGAVTHRTTLAPTGAPTLGLAGKSVALYARRSGSATWSRACSATTSSTGTASCVTRPTRNTEYAWRFRGSGNQGSATSRPYVVRVQPKVTISASATTLAPGSSLTFAGSVTPRHIGQRVSLQRFVRGQWRTVASSNLSRTGTYVFQISPRATYSYRVYKRSDADHSYGISPTRRVHSR